MARKFYFTTTLSVKGEVISEKMRSRRVDEPRPNGEKSSQEPIVNEGQLYPTSKRVKPVATGIDFCEGGG